MHEGDLAAGAIVLSFQHTLAQGSLMVEGRPQSTLYTAVKWRRKDFIQEWWALAAEMHQDEARVAGVFLHDQEVINLLEESSSGGIVHMQDLLLNQFFRPGYAEWACPLAISVKHSHIIPTVDVKGAQQSLVFNCDVPQQERDIIHVGDDIGGVAALARLVQWGWSPSAECRQQLSRFQFPTFVTKCSALVAGPKFRICGLLCMDEWVCIGVGKAIDGDE